jgi:hypothetical protein
MNSGLDFTTDTVISIPEFFEFIQTTGEAGRRSWVKDLIPNTDIIFLQDGNVSEHILREAIFCYLNGQFLATILLSFSLIERSIAARLSHVGEKSSGRSTDLLKAACDKKWLTAEERKNLDILNKTIRNPVAHFKALGDSTRVEPPSFEQHAKDALTAAVHVCDLISI